MLAEFGNILLFLIHGVVFVAITLVVAWLLRPNRPSHEKLLTYECGEDAVGSAWIRFNNRFYIVALMFLVFEVEVVLLFPWALVFQELGWYAFWAMIIFVGLILIGFVYEIGKGNLEWDMPEPATSTYEKNIGVISSYKQRTPEEVRLAAEKELT